MKQGDNVMDPSVIQGFVAMPWAVQLVLASGYCAYLLAYMGMRDHHRAPDIIFTSIAFGLVAMLVLAVPASYSPIARGSLAFGAACCAGAAWRLKVRAWVRWIARKLDYSWADDAPRAWDRLLEETGHGPTQFVVQLTDGKYLHCTDAQRVEALPFGPYVVGTSGDVLMYADRVTEIDGTEADIDAVFDEDWGNLVTYIPHDQIRKISIRLKPR